MSSISPNGSALGTQGVTDLASTPSWRSPTEYFDPSTGKTWSADTLQDLLALLEENDVALFDLDEMKRRGFTTNKGRDPQVDPSGQWERLLIRLDHYNDPEQARAIIIDALANPDVQISENKGGGRIRTFEVKGKRAVIAHEVHHDDERGPHFMAQVHVTSIDEKGFLNPRIAFSKSEHQQAMLAHINEALAEAGLAPVSFVARGDTTGANEAERKAQLNPQQTEEYREAAERGELPELLDEAAAEEVVEALPTSARKEMLRKAAEQSASQAATLYAQAQTLQKQNAQYRTALRAIEAEEQRLERIADLEAKLSEVKQEAAAAETQNAAKLADAAQVIETTVTELNATQSTLEATQERATKLSEERDGLKAELDEALEELGDARAEVATTTAAVEQLETRLESAQTEAATAKNRVSELTDENKGLVRDLDAERLARTNLEAEHERELAALQRAKDAETKRANTAEAKAEEWRGKFVDEQTGHNAVKAELKTETARADRAEATATKAQDELATLREQLAIAQAEAKAQAADLQRERDARQAAEQEARKALSAQATAEAQRDARPTQEALQDALAAKAKAEGQRDAMQSALTRVTAELERLKAGPSNDGGGEPKPGR